MHLSVPVDNELPSSPFTSEVFVAWALFGWFDASYVVAVTRRYYPVGRDALTGKIGWLLWSGR
jgi:hypothetical protein